MALACFIAFFGTLLLLPAFWTLFEQNTAASKKLNKALQIPVLPSLARLSVRYPLLGLLLTALLSVGAYSGFKHQTFQTNYKKFSTGTSRPWQLPIKYRQFFGINGSSWMVLADDLQEAGELAKKMKNVDFVDRVDSISDFLRPDAGERQQLIQT